MLDKTALVHNLPQKSKTKFKERFNNDPDIKKYISRGQEIQRSKYKKYTSYETRKETSYETLVRDTNNLEEYVGFVKRGQRLPSISDDMVKEMHRRHLKREDLVPVAWERAKEHTGRVFKPEETWIIGDTARDYRAAKHHGANGVLVRTNGIVPDGELDACEAELILDDLTAYNAFWYVL